MVQGLKYEGTTILVKVEIVWKYSSSPVKYETTFKSTDLLERKVEHNENKVKCITFSGCEALFRIWQVMMTLLLLFFLFLSSVNTMTYKDWNKIRLNGNWILLNIMILLNDENWNRLSIVFS